LLTGGLNYGILNEESKKKISKTLKEKYASGEIVAPKGMLGQDPWNKGLPAKKFICPHRNKEIGGAGNYKRWHGDNCKLKL